MNLNGLLPVDKPEGLTSYDTIRHLKKIVRGQKIGHSGTLDPFATGLLLILFGEGTKLSDLLSEVDKEYVATLRLGEETDTQDRTGRVISTYRGSEWPDAEKVRSILTDYRGRVRQRIPKFSAAKHQGVPFYELARSGRDVPEREREVEVAGVTLTAYAPPDATLHITCGKGFYVRALASEIGERLGTGAHLTALRRVRWGRFKVEDAPALADLAGVADLARRGVSLGEALSFLPSVEMTAGELTALRAGRAVKLFEKRAIVGAIKKGSINKMRVYDTQGNLSVVAEVEPLSPLPDRSTALSDGLVLRPFRVLQAV